ncbi:MAG: 3-phosphoshikimate 1-carboxyvinyltransferase, partial [Evtepia sp.]
ADYIQMTRGYALQFGVSSQRVADGYAIPGGQTYRSCGVAEVEGDWSNAAFWLCAGAMPGGDVRCSGLQGNAMQGDRAVMEYLAGAGLRELDGTYGVCEGQRRCFDVDAANIPDLVPILAALGAVSEGTTIIRNASRLRLKESDRLHAVTVTLNALGAQVTEVEDGLVIDGVSRLKGGVVDSFGDHRIAMMAAIASAACTDAVVIHNAQAVRKSYPNFWRDLDCLGKHLLEEGLDE